VPAVDATVVRAADAAPPVAGLLAVARGSASSIAHPPPGERSFAAVFPLVLGALAVDFFFVDGSGASDQPPTELIPGPLEPPPADPIDIAMSARTDPAPTRLFTLTVTTAMNSIRFMIMTTSPAELALAGV